MGTTGTRAIAENYVDFVDTDDHPILDFGFVRSFSHGKRFRSTPDRKRMTLAAAAGSSSRVRVGA